MIEKIAYFMKHEEERRAIAEASAEKGVKRAHIRAPRGGDAEGFRESLRIAALQGSSNPGNTVVARRCMPKQSRTWRIIEIEFGIASSAKERLPRNDEAYPHPHQFLFLRNLKN